MVFKNKILEGDCLDRMSELPDECVDTIITDPPYGLGFMGKRWDHDVPSSLVFEEMLRVAKPGAFLLCFAGTRTWHRMAVNIEDAGWQIRDTIMWLYGSGFPKSYDISKGIDKAAGVEREVVGKAQYSQPAKSGHHAGLTDPNVKSDGERFTPDVTAPSSDDAKRWSGWGTALKPAWEPVIVAMKPVEETFVSNALEHGVSGLNINDCRIPILDVESYDNNRRGPTERSTLSEGDRITADKTYDGGWKKRDATPDMPAGRFPSNVILDEESARLLDKQSGVSRSVASKSSHGSYDGGSHTALLRGESNSNNQRDDFGGASRFFYCAKASRSERGEANNHPTVKPVELMRYLCRLTKTPTGGVVLDPFLGSGTTAVAARLEGRDFIGIEKEPEYVAIAYNRVKPYLEQKTLVTAKGESD